MPSSCMFTLHSNLLKMLSSFHGSYLNFTALPYAPYFDKVPGNENKDGSPSVDSFKGTDYELLKSLAKVMNFRVHILHTENWGEVSTNVE